MTADGHHEVLTRAAHSDWPTVQVEVPGLGSLERSLVLEKEFYILKSMPFK